MNRFTITLPGLRAVALTAAGLVGAAGAQAQGSDDALPTGTISFFNLVQCPSGWSPLTLADGRATVPLVTGAGNGGVAGAALGSGQDPSHSHTFASSISLSEVEFVGIAGCCNKNLAEDGRQDFSGTSAGSSTGLPYVQLLICMKMAAPAAAPAPPRGMMAYNGSLGCPDGWSQNLTTQGRFPVGLPDKGTPGTSFGGPPLQPLEMRTHAHAFSGSVTTSGRDVALASGCCAHGYGRNDTYDYSGTSGASDSAWPYIQLLQCEKN